MTPSPGTTREYRMEFGAEVRATGEVRFNLWAPGVEAVSLCLYRGNGETLFPLKRERGGWFRFTGRDAGPGDRYHFQLPSGMRVPDPASRFQPGGVHGPSEIIDPAVFNWPDETWRGRPWEETVLYELHVGTFCREGTFAGVEQGLDHLVELGVTAIELMPIGAFPGRRNWGYDGVLPFAPAACYGRPESLKKLIAAAHARNLMVLLDVVYNHFGPEGNYLHLYAPQFFTKRYKTPWGEAINFAGAESESVRRFFIHNALYWLEEYHFDGLRLDAVHAIHDHGNGNPHVLEELSEAVTERFGTGRHIHLVLENDKNQARYLRERSKDNPAYYRAQLNDDFHHALHVLLTGETGGYYMDYAGTPSAHLARCLAKGFAYQGEISSYRDNTPRGETSGDLPPTAFIGFLQNHDQIGNRALGERLSVLVAPRKLRAALAVLLLSPSVPLLFMGEEWGCEQPFPFFCDFQPELAQAVTAGRYREFARFPEFNDPESRKRIPDPADPQTFVAATLDWRSPSTEQGRRWLNHYRELLTLRMREIIPRLPGVMRGKSSYEQLGPGGLRVVWPLRGGEVLLLLANLSDHPLAVDPPPSLAPIFLEGAMVPQSNGGKAMLEAWSVAWYLDSSIVRE